MDITPVIPKDRMLINGYGDNGFVISHKRVEGSIILAPQQLHPLGALTLDTLTPEHLTPILDLAPEMILLGVGPSHRPTPSPIKRWCAEHGFGIDAMNTGAACRTYNILLAEERRVVAVLLAV
jgi:uncharacterized protein